MPATELGLAWRSGERLSGGVWSSEPSEEAGDDTVTYTWVGVTHVESGHSAAELPFPHKGGVNQERQPTANEGFHWT